MEKKETRLQEIVGQRVHQKEKKGRKKAKEMEDRGWKQGSGVAGEKGVSGAL